MVPPKPGRARASLTCGNKFMLTHEIRYKSSRWDLGDSKKMLINGANPGITLPSHSWPAGSLQCGVYSLSLSGYLVQ